jgi:uncharacterized protein (TIGR03905 family)
MKAKLDGVCADEVTFEVRDGLLRNIQFTSGCPGNLKALAALADGLTPEAAAAKLKGITCGDKPTSCSDQFARALEKARGGDDGREAA